MMIDNFLQGIWGRTGEERLPYFRLASR